VEVIAHTALATAYKGMMTDIENRGFFFFPGKAAAKSDAIDRHRRALRVIYTVVIYLLCLYSSSFIQPRLAYMFKPYIKYCHNAHIRRQYQKLYSLYLAELVIRRKNSSKGDVEEFREIASDVRDYYQTLPSLKSLTALLVGVLSITGTVFAIFDVKVPFYTILSQGSIFANIVLILVITQIGFAIAICPFMAAFHFKRFLFKGDNSDEFGFLGADKAKATDLYNSSVYKKEDELFALLGGKEQKPKEVPIDIILRISYGVLAIAFFFYLGISSLLRIEDTQLVLAVTTGFTVFVGFFFIGLRFGITKVESKLD
jgi:hypothetical protein